MDEGGCPPLANGHLKKDYVADWILRENELRKLGDLVTRRK